MGKRLVCGVGTNDADYPVTTELDGKRVKCPYYKTWASMIHRCYSKRKPAYYKGITVCEEWHSFMNFKKWMETQPWEGNVLDKDMRVLASKIYSPSTCMFIPPNINTLCNTLDSKRGEYPIGVSLLNGSYKSQVHNGKGDYIYLGLFPTPEEAYYAWRDKKLEVIREAMSQCSRKDIKQALQQYIDHRLKNNYYLK